MTDMTVRRGHDAWANQDAPNTEYPSGRYIQMRDTDRRGFVYLPLSGIRGRTVLSATLTGHVAGVFAAQDVSVRRIASNWSAGRLNWNNLPGIVGGTVTTTTGVLADGDEVALDVTTLVQQVANGSAWYGFRLTTDAATAQKFYSFDSGQSSWTLTVELSDAPEVPSGLSPNDGSVSSGAPIVSWDFTDLGGASTEQASLRVQVDAAASAVSPDFDSLEVASTEPELDLAATAFTPLTSGQTTFWRVQVKDGAGMWSDWSDWAEFTYTPQPTLTVDSPTGGVIGDPSPVVLAHIGSGTLDRWRIRVTKGTDRTAVLYDSNVTPATDLTDIAHTVPLRNDDGVKIFKDDLTYQINIRAWDDVDRADSVTDDPTYIEAWVTVAFDDDLGVTAPTDFTVTQVDDGPRLAFQWERGSAADAWVIEDGGRLYARLTEDDVTEVAGVYSWDDEGYSTSFESHTWRVRAIENGDRSVPSNSVVLATAIEGVWLVHGTDIVWLSGDSVGNFKTLDRRATYQPVNVNHDVDIITGQEGVSGSFDGGLYERTEQSVVDALEALQAIKDDPAVTVQFVWASRSVPVKLRHLTFLPAPLYVASTHLHDVSFEFWQVGDFDQDPTA